MARRLTSEGELDPVAEPREAEPRETAGPERRHGERRAGSEGRTRERQLELAMECAGHRYWSLDATTERFVDGVPWPAVGWEPEAFPPTLSAWIALVHPDDRAASGAAYRDHVAGRTSDFRAEMRVRAKDGAWRWALSAGRALARSADGRAMQLVGTTTDISGIKRLEEQLRQADRLASLGTVAAGVAHEVNNPLASVAANLTFIEEALSAEPGAAASATPEELREAIREAREGAERVKRTVQGLRQFAAPPGDLPRGPIDPAPQIQAALRLVRNELAARARLRIEIPTLLPRVVAGEAELSQVVVNLLVNAGQAIPEGAPPADHEIALVAEAQPERLAITVKDTGVGIPPGDLPRLFDPFFTTKDVGAGSGLGLSVCHGIVSVLGGTIEVESSPGAGATFRVYLPAAGGPFDLPPLDPSRRGRP